MAVKPETNIIFWPNLLAHRGICYTSFEFQLFCFLIGQSHITCLLTIPYCRKVAMHFVNADLKNLH